MKAIGHKVWTVPGGHIPLQSTGLEPEFVSYDKLCFLNTGDHEAKLEITFFYNDRDPIGPYEVSIAPRRTRHVRINDLIDPEAVPLETDYACVIESNVPVVVQFIHQDTRQPENALFSTMAFPIS